MKRQMTMVLAVAALISGAALAQTKEVTIGYQDMLDPYRSAQETQHI
jgi:ABC-type taurine transport system substrate-binding protein